ncbi:MAG: phosphate ABC transporter substrate-binding protein [Burkholderiales bacterium]
MLKLNIVFKTMIAGAIVVVSGVASADIVVVASAKSTASNLSNEQVVELFSGRGSAFQDGHKTHLHDVAETNPIRDEFYTKALGKNASQIKAMWSRLTFSGKALPPVEDIDAAALKKALATDPDAVGYLDSASVDSSLKVLAKIK